MWLVFFRVMLHLSNVRQWHSSSRTLEGHLMKMQSGTTLSSSMSFLMVLFVSSFYIPFCCWQIFSLRPLSIGTCTSGWELPGVSISFDQYGIGRNLEWFQSPKQNSFWVQGAICREYLCPDWSWWCCVEIMDFGYPQNLSPEILKLYITQEGVGSPFSSKVSPISMMSIHSIFTNGTEMPFL